MKNLEDSAIVYAKLAIHIEKQKKSIWMISSIAISGTCSRDIDVMLWNPLLDNLLDTNL